MKKILFLLVLISIHLTSWSQNTYIGGTKSTVVARGALKADSVFQLPVIDTSKRTTVAGVNTTIGQLAINNADSVLVIMTNGYWHEIQGVNEAHSYTFTASQTITGILDLGVALSSNGKLTFFNSSNSNQAAITPSASSATSTSFVLPPTNGNNHDVLAVNGSGVTDWENRLLDGGVSSGLSSDSVSVTCTLCTGSSVIMVCPTATTPPSSAMTVYVRRYSGRFEIVNVGSSSNGTAFMWALLRP